MKSRCIGMWTIWTAVAIFLLVAPARAIAHCDGVDGPVVKAAQRALDTGDPTLALIWVQERDEPEIRAAFEHTLVVRSLSPQARELADRFFFETLVRVHRAGEGAPYTGLKPAGRDPGPAIHAADKALDDGTLEPLATLLADTMQAGLRAHFKEAVTAKAFKSGDLGGGREYVRAYVELIHYAERLYEATRASAHGHGDEAEPASTSH